MKTKPPLIILLLVLGSCLRSGLFAQSWIQLPDFPAAERDDGVCFVIGAKAWCGTGLQVGWIPGGDFYCLDLVTETWSPSASMSPGMERQYACAFSDGVHGYVVGGVDGSGTVLNDVWMYDPTGNSWVQKTSKPGTLLAASSSFVIGDTAYVVGGNNNLGVNASREVWAYSFAGDSWTRKTDTPFLGRWRASACTMGTKGYLGLGRDENGTFCRELYEYEPASDSWQQITSIPGLGRNYASMVTDGTDLLVFGGIDTSGYCYDSIRRYVYSPSAWTAAYPIPTHVGRKGGMGFFAGGSFYYTCGIDSASMRLKETWKYGQSIGLKDGKGRGALRIHPNPVSETIFVGSTGNGDVYTIYDIRMQPLLYGQLKPDAATIDVSVLPEGIYFLQLRRGSDVYTTKWVKE